MKQALFTAVLLLTSVTLSQAEDVRPDLYQPFQPSPRISSEPVFRSYPQQVIYPTSVPPQVVADDLPPAASALLKTFDQESDQIRARIEAEIAAKREVLIQQLQAMQDGYTREAKLDEAVAIRDAIRKLRRTGMTVLSYPVVQGGYGGLTSYRGQIGKVLHFEVVGSNSGPIYGADTYTDDSDLGTVAVHLGLLKVGEKGVVKVTILPGRDSYISSTRHGIASTGWSQYPGSYKVGAISGGSRAVATSSTALTDPGSLSSYGNRVGQSFEFQVTGSTSGGTIWGTGIYTGDSRLSVTAVHAGVLRDGESGVVKVTILPGDSRYLGSLRNGISSYDYGPYPFGYRVDSTTTNRPSNVVPRLFLHGAGGLRLHTPAPGTTAPPGSTVIPGEAIRIGETSDRNFLEQYFSPTPSLPTNGLPLATEPK